MDQNVSLLSDTKCSIRRLVFDSRIPPAIKMDDVTASVKFNPVPPALTEMTKEGWAKWLLELIYQFTTRLGWCLAGSTKPGDQIVLP